ncbi:MAG TPA: serine--tRNA ligase, partial [Geminicoccaceae bacterium]|nr:serine--tRNA ligase [Geminicoccaceae bacterium]
MLDLKWLRDHPDALDAALARRGREPAAGAVLALDREHRELQAEIQEAQARRNALSKEIGALRARGGDAAPLMAEAEALKERVRGGEEALRAKAEALEELLAGLPNVPDPDVPDGLDERDNVVLRRWGEPRRFDFEPREHDDLGARLGMDFARAARLSGARFVTLFGPLARLERALQQYMLDLHTREHGYTEVAVPYLVRDAAPFGTGQLPKLAEDLFRTTTGHWLIPTAEVPLTNLVADEILGADALPLRFTAGTPCFRSEAGAAGKDTKGMLRQHQFNKVELVSVAHPEDSAAELERMTRCAETVLQRLGLPYRVVALCTGDLGFAARRTYDIEVWLPGQGRYREIS